MAWKKLLADGDPVTDLTGTAYRLLLIDSAGDVVELAHGAADKVLTSQGASADPTWEDAASGAHALGAGQSDVTIDSPADNEVLAYDGVDTWINQTAAEAGLLTDAANAIDSDHYTDGSIDNEHLADGAVDTEELAADCIDGTKIADDVVDTEHLAADSVDAAAIDDSATDIAFAQIILTPAATGTGTTEGTLFYDSDDDHVYVYVAA